MVHERIQEFSSGGGGGVQVSLTKKALTFSFAFFLVLSLSISKQYIIFQGFRGGLTFSRGVQLFQGGGGSNCLFPIETHITCDFPGGYRPPAPLWIRTCGFRLFPQATILIHRRLTCISFLTGLYLECGYKDLRCLRN